MLSHHPPAHEGTNMCCCFDLLCECQQVGEQQDRGQKD